MRPRLSRASLSWKRATPTASTRRFGFTTSPDSSYRQEFADKLRGKLSSRLARTTTRRRCSRGGRHSVQCLPRLPWPTSRGTSTIAMLHDAERNWHTPATQVAHLGLQQASLPLPSLAASMPLRVAPAPLALCCLFIVRVSSRWFPLVALLPPICLVIKRLGDHVDSTPALIGSLVRAGRKSGWSWWSWLVWSSVSSTSARTLPTGAVV